MGDGTDFADIERFMRSPEGQAHLESIRQSLVGRSIKAVEFSNDTHAVGIALLLDDRGAFYCQLPELDADALRMEFQAVLEREYYKDFPERKP